MEEWSKKMSAPPEMEKYLPVTKRQPSVSNAEQLPFCMSFFVK